MLALKIKYEDVKISNKCWRFIYFCLHFFYVFFKYYPFIW